MIGQFTYVKAKSIDDAVKQLGTPNSTVLAGGTDLLGCLRDEVLEAGKVVSISGLKELHGISAGPNGGLRIGALTTIAEVAAAETIRSKYAVLAQAAGEIASPQLRNQGTIGGNLCQRPRCWYFRGDFHCAKKGGDMCYAEGGENMFHCIFGGDPCYIVYPSDSAPALCALNAGVRIAGPGGTRTLAVDKFHQLPGVDIEKENVLQRNEIVTEVLLPAPPPGLKSAYRKVRARQAWDFALTSTAIALTMDGGTVKQARIFLGGVAPVPWRAEAAEAALKGKKLDKATILAAAEAAVQGARPLEANAYKVDLVKGTLTEQLASLA
ncbi:MAG TPA: xanthine dehydrogenase family protein subunit M [Acidobacteriota bacterium]|nr:xanthine dehydrogenase family protein subunit M [Acidobacteriota bacterium]